MKTHLTNYLPILLAFALPAAAQTTPVHHTAAAHHEHEYAGGGCLRLPEISPKIPALPAGTPCPKALYTETRTADLKLDYASPLLSPSVRESLSTGTSTYSLGYIDTKAGTGALVEQGKFLSVKYTGYLEDGKKFDSSYDHPGAEPIDFPYGQHRVIPGWDTGFEGMRVGGKRRIFIPYELAYGEAGRPPVIPAKSELIFDVEVVAQNDKAPEHKPATPPARPMPAHPATPSGATGATTPKPATSTAPASSTTPKK